MARFIGTATLLGLAISPAPPPPILQSSAIAQIILKSKSSLNRLSDLPPSKFWSSVKFLCKSSSSVPTFLHQAKIHSSDLEKLTVLTRSSPHASIILLLLWALFLPPLSSYCTEKMIISLISNLSSKTACGPDSYYSFNCSPLSHIFNLSMKSDLFPQSCKLPNAVPAPLPLPSLWFRPISFLSLVIMLLEKHIPYPLDQTPLLNSIAAPRRMLNEINAALE